MQTRETQRNEGRLLAGRLPAQRSSFLLGLLLVVYSSCLAQNDRQLWTDFQIDYPFGGQYLVEATASYQTLLNKDQEWRAFYFTPAFEFTRFRKVDLLFNVPIGFTRQQPGNATHEADPSLGARFRVSQGKRIDLNIIAKAEERFFYQVESQQWTSSNRLRLKAEVFISLNGPNLFTDRLLYSIADYEEFIVTDQQLNERYANLRRARIGLGYRHSYAHRFELIYTKQSSRDQISDSFATSNDILQVRYILYLNPATAVKP